MNLPNYFLADLPPEATLGPAMISEACATLKRNRGRYLARRPTQGLVELLSQVAERWLNPGYPFRQLALANSPAATGFGPATLAAGLDACFKELTQEKLLALLQQEFGHPQRLDALVASEPEQQTNRSAITTAPGLLVHIMAGNLPVPALMAIVFGVLVRAAQFIKCASGASLLPRLFAHSLYDADPKLGACLELAEWRGGNDSLERVLFDHADCVTATGSDEALAAIRRHLRANTRFLAYGHRLSFAYVSNGVLSGLGARTAADQAAADVAAWNQLGCLSPQVVYVQTGGNVAPELFAELLAQALARRETAEPRGELPIEVASAIASRRAIYELRAAHSLDTRVWSSPQSTAWTVVYEADPQFQLSCLHRFIYVKSVAGLTEALHSAGSVRDKVSSVGLAAPAAQLRDLASELSHWGVTRVCPLGRMQCPSLAWRHDGRPPLGDLITWTDWEQ